MNKLHLFSIRYMIMSSHINCSTEIRDDFDHAKPRTIEQQCFYRIRSILTPFCGLKESIYLLLTTFPVQKYFNKSTNQGMRFMRLQSCVKPFSSLIGLLFEHSNVFEVEFRSRSIATVSRKWCSANHLILQLLRILKIS